MADLAGESRIRGFSAAGNDPCDNYGNANPTSNRFKNCNAEVNNTAFRQLSSLTVISKGGQDLIPETSQNYTFGFVVQPDFFQSLGNLQLAVDYYAITVDDEISQYGTVTVLNSCYNSVEFRTKPGFCDLVTRNASGQLVISQGYVNIARQRVRGIDYNARYTHMVYKGDIRVNLLITRYLEQSTQNTNLAGDHLFDYNGSAGQPKYTGQFDITYHQDSWKVRYGLDWVRKTNDYENAFGPGTSFETEGQILTTPDYYLHSLSFEYQGKQNWNAIVGVRNLLDEDPPVISAYGAQRVGTAPLQTFYDYLGRTYYVNLSKKF